MRRNRNTHITWRDEKTSKELESVKFVPSSLLHCTANRYQSAVSDTNDLPDVTHLRPFYNPNANELRSMVDSTEGVMKDALVTSRQAPDMDMIPGRGAIFDFIDKD